LRAASNPLALSRKSLIMSFPQCLLDRAVADSLRAVITRPGMKLTKIIPPCCVTHRRLPLPVTQLARTSQENISTALRRGNDEHSYSQGSTPDFFLASSASPSSPLQISPTRTGDTGESSRSFREKTIPSGTLPTPSTSPPPSPPQQFLSSDSVRCWDRRTRFRLSRPSGALVIVFFSYFRDGKTPCHASEIRR